MKTTIIITWIRRSFLVSLGLFLFAFILLMQRPSSGTLEYALLITLSRFSLIGVAISIAVLLGFLASSFNYRRLYNVIVLGNNITKSKKSQNMIFTLLKLVGLLLASIFTVGFKILRFGLSTVAETGFSNSDDNNKSPFERYIDRDTEHSDYYVGEYYFGDIHGGFYDETLYDGTYDDD